MQAIAGVVDPAPLNLGLNAPTVQRLNRRALEFSGGAITGAEFHVQPIPGFTVKDVAIVGPALDYSGRKLSEATAAAKQGAVSTARAMVARFRAPVPPPAPARDLRPDPLEEAAAGTGLVLPPAAPEPPALPPLTIEEARDAVAAATDAVYNARYDVPRNLATIHAARARLNEAQAEFRRVSAATAVAPKRDDARRGYDDETPERFVNLLGYVPPPAAPPAPLTPDEARAEALGDPEVIRNAARVKVAAARDALYNASIAVPPNPATINAARIRVKEAQAEFEGVFRGGKRHKTWRRSMPTRYTRRKI